MLSPKDFLILCFGLLLWLLVGCSDGEPRSPVVPSPPSLSRDLPPSVLEAVGGDLSRRTQLPLERFQPVEASQATWPDGCLGLGRADESCTQALVEGWRIVLSSGERGWVYRTDGEGRVVRLEGEAGGKGR